MRERDPLRGVGRFTSLAAYAAVAFSSTFACGDDREYQENGGNAGAAGSAGSAGASSGGKAGSTGRGGASGSSGSSGSGGTAGDAGADSGSSGSGAGRGGSAGAAAGGGGTSAGEGGAPPEVSGAGGTPDGDGESGAGGNGGEAGSGPAVCGNGEVEGDEVCDEGEDNALELLACAPDCSRIIVAKHILFSENLDSGDLSPNPVAAADAACLEGYKAMFVYGSTRRATTSPYQTKNSVDWVLQPYTYYVNEVENLVWLTRDVALLGVENGAFTELANSIFIATECVGSNMNIDGTTMNDNNCIGWTTDEGDRQCGIPGFTTHEYLDFGDVTCSNPVAFYCVEQ